MTTEHRPAPPNAGTAALIRTAGATLLLGLVAAAIGGLVAGSAAAYGVLVGVAIVVGVLAFGTFTVHVAAGLMPASAMLVALLTYTLQVLLTGVALTALSASSLLEETLRREWVGGTVIGGTLLWITVQVILTSSRRIPIYDLPDYEPVSESADEPVRRATHAVSAGVDRAVSTSAEVGER